MCLAPLVSTAKLRELASAYESLEHNFAHSAISHTQETLTSLSCIYFTIRSDFDVLPNAVPIHDHTTTKPMSHLANEVFYFCTSTIKQYLNLSTSSTNSQTVRSHRVEIIPDLRNAVQEAPLHNPYPSRPRSRHRPTYTAQQV